jgi:hypothetical protein
LESDVLHNSIFGIDVDKELVNRREKQDIQGKKAVKVI